MSESSRMSKHKTLELAERLKAEGDIQADKQVREMHAQLEQQRQLIVQMRDALDEFISINEELLRDIYGRTFIKNAVALFFEADQYLKDNQ